MQIVLTDGTLLEVILVTGEKRSVQGARRDVLTFVFADRTMDDIDALFTEKNCERIKLITEEEEALHTGYVIRVELAKKLVETQSATDSTDAISEQRVMISMAQRTYSETKLAEVAKENTETALAVAELGVVIAEMM